MALAVKARCGTRSGCSTCLLLHCPLQAIRDRNYLHANDIYLRLAIGNAPWPIGAQPLGTAQA